MTYVNDNPLHASRYPKNAGLEPVALTVQVLTLTTSRNFTPKLSCGSYFVRPHYYFI